MTFRLDAVDAYERGLVKQIEVASLQIDSGNNKPYIRLESTHNTKGSITAKVELEEPIHQILNLAEFNDRAVSIHIYSKPYDHCISYCRDTDTFKDVKLFYTSVDGKVCDGVKL